MNTGLASSALPETHIRSGFYRHEIGVKTVIFRRRATATEFLPPQDALRRKIATWPV